MSKKSAVYIALLVGRVRGARDVMSSDSEGSHNPGSSRHDVISVTDQSAADRRKRLKASGKSNGKGHHVVRLDGGGHRTDDGGYRGHARDKPRGQNRGHDHWKSVERDIRTAMTFVNERAQKQRAAETPRGLEQQDMYSASDPDD